MTTGLPKDRDANPIPCLRLRDGKAHTISSTSSAARNTTAMDAATKVIKFFATEDVFIKFGTDNTVTATTADHFMPKGVQIHLNIGGGLDDHLAYISVLRSDTDGSVYISECE